MTFDFGEKSAAERALILRGFKMELIEYPDQLHEVRLATVPFGLLSIPRALAETK